MRRVAGALEAVELERGERVGRRDLVLHEDPAAGRCHARELGEHELRAPNVVEGAPRTGKVEVAIVERQGRGVALDEGRVLGRPPARCVEQLRHEVDSHDRADERGERER